jgi:hypothetical protein
MNLLCFPGLEISVCNPATFDIPGMLAQIGADEIGPPDCCLARTGLLKSFSFFFFAKEKSLG